MKSHAIAVSITLIALFTPLAGGQTFEVLPKPPSGAWAIMAMSGNGDTIAFPEWVWRKGVGLVELDSTGFPYISAQGVSPNGDFICGLGNNGTRAEGIIWDREGTAMPVGPAPGQDQSSYFEDVSDNMVGVGLRDTDDKGIYLQGLHWSGGTFTTVSTGEWTTWLSFVSADGTVAFGISGDDHGRQDVIMSVDGGDPTIIVEADYGFVTGISSDGRFATGRITARGYLWSADDGVSMLPPGIVPLAVTDDGRMVAGGQAIWRDGIGVTSFGEFLEEEQFVVPSGWQLSRVLFMSGDGRVFVGKGLDPDDAYQYWRLDLDADVDTDGDGLLDSWETEGEGLDVNGDGTVDLDLYAMGARPDRKDTFVEIDVMPGVPYTQSAIQMVIDAFDQAPVDNPDGSTGITLHIDFDSIDAVPFQETYDDTFVAYDTFKDQYFGTAQERVDDNWEHIRAARREVFRYCIFANKMTPTPAWGIAEQPGNDFFITMGGATREDRLIASTFMHELGHNLGLRHGGGDEINRKCNYVSVMNYAFDQYEDIWGDPLRVNFSNEATQALDEGNLDEAIGLVSVEYGYVMTYYSYDDGNGGRGHAWIQLDTPSFDWDQDGDQEPGAVVDLNWFDANESSTPDEILNSYNDWALIELPVAETGDFVEYVHETPDPSQEITQEIYDWYQAEIPPAPAPCRADITRDRAVDFADLLAILDAWGPCQGDCPADLDGDDVVTIDDLLLVLTGWGPCG